MTAEREPVMEKLNQDVQDVADAMAAIVHRQNRWTRRDLHLAVGGFSRCSGAVASLAIRRLEDQGRIRFDAPFGPDSVYLRAIGPYEVLADRINRASGKSGVL